MANSKKSCTTLLFLLFCTTLATSFPNPTELENLASPTCSSSAKLGVCADLLQWLARIRIGTPPTTPCCPLIRGLVDLEAAACLCTAINAKVLGIVNLEVNLAIQLLLGSCAKQLPPGFKCSA